MAEAQTLSSERRAFLLRLRTEPGFFLKHVPALSFAAYRRIRNRLATTLSGKHGGRKRWPQWLDPYEPLVSSTCDRKQPLGPQAHEARDPEDDFARHRWGFLLESLLERCADPRAPLEECLRWIERHTDKSGREWEPYSACERVANLLVFLSAAPAPYDRYLPPRLHEFLGDSLDWIYRHLEYYGPCETNNHILNNARALVLAGVALDNQRAFSVGMKIFRACLPTLILEGGFLRERSSHYQLIVLNWTLDAWRCVAAYTGQRSRDECFLRSHAERMLNAASMLCDSDGRLLALIGDVSPDATPAQSLGRLALLYPELWPATRPTPRCVELQDGWFRVSAGPQVILGNFPAGRYPPDFPTHGHCDLTSFVWLNDGNEVLQDGGRHRYTPDAVSLFQKSASGHNVVLVNGIAPLCETLLTNGSWWPLPYARAHLQANESGGGIALAHDGLARTTPVKHHTRQILPRENGLRVVDSFAGEGTVEVAFCWHFAVGFGTFDAESLTVSGLQGRVKLEFEGVPCPPSVAPVLGDRPGSWTSRTYGKKQPMVGICLRWRVCLPAVVATQFTLTVHPQSDTPPAETA